MGSFTIRFGITLTEASKIFGINRHTLAQWVSRGWIRVIYDGHPKRVLTADVERMAGQYIAGGGRQGKRVFDKDGKPIVRD